MEGFIDYVPFIVGAGLFLGAVFAGVFKGKKEAAVEPTKEVVSGVIQDNYSMLMMSEQLRMNKDTLERAIQSMDSLAHEVERLREHAKDIQKQLEFRK